MPGESGATVVTILVWFYFFPREAAGASRTRHSPRPHCWARDSWITRASSRRENAEVWVNGRRDERRFLIPPHAARGREKKERAASENAEVWVNARRGGLSDVVIASASEAIHLGPAKKAGLLRRFTPRNDGTNEHCRHARPCAGHPRSSVAQEGRGWPGRRAKRASRFPAMTQGGLARSLSALLAMAAERVLV